MLYIAQKNKLDDEIEQTKSVRIKEIVDNRLISIINEDLPIVRLNGHPIIESLILSLKKHEISEGLLWSRLQELIKNESSVSDIKSYSNQLIISYIIYHGTNNRSSFRRCLHYSDSLIFGDPNYYGIFLWKDWSLNENIEILKYLNSKREKRFWNIDLFIKLFKANSLEYRLDELQMDDTLIDIILRVNEAVTHREKPELLYSLRDIAPPAYFALLAKIVSDDQESIYQSKVLNEYKNLDFTGERMNWSRLRRQQGVPTSINKEDWETWIESNREMIGVWESALSIQSLRKDKYALYQWLSVK